MTQTKNSDLVLAVPCQEDRSGTWALEPEGRDSFRIVVRCRRAQGAPSPKPRSWFCYFGAIAQAVLQAFSARFPHVH
jgi:hypothetical protein